MTAVARKKFFRVPKRPEREYRQPDKLLLLPDERLIEQQQEDEEEGAWDGESLWGPLPIC